MAVEEGDKRGAIKLRKIDAVLDLRPEIFSLMKPYVDNGQTAITDAFRV
jgi:hypothetical protein